MELKKISNNDTTYVCLDIRDSSDLFVFWLSIDSVDSANHKR